MISDGRIHTAALRIRNRHRVQSSSAQTKNGWALARGAHHTASKIPDANAINMNIYMNIHQFIKAHSTYKYKIYNSHQAHRTIDVCVCVCVSVCVCMNAWMKILITMVYADRKRSSARLIRKRGVTNRSESERSHETAWRTRTVRRTDVCAASFVLTICRLPFGHGQSDERDAHLTCKSAGWRCLRCCCWLGGVKSEPQTIGGAHTKSTMKPSTF